MPSFNPKNVVFITNKWDLVRKQIDSSDEDSSDSDNEEETEIWEKLKMDIKHKWPYVAKENIFKMILKDVIILFSCQKILQNIGYMIMLSHFVLRNINCMIAFMSK